MRRNLRLKYRWSLVVSLLFVSGQLALGQGVSVLTRNYNNQRTGANLSETSLNVTNVNSSQFGKLFMLPVDDQVYAGILYVSGLQIAGGTHNVIYAATMNNSVYAFDADTLGPPLWFSNFNGTGQASSSAEVGGGTGYTDFRGDIGIVGTPVIDGSAQVMYFVTRTVVNGTTIQSLHAVNILTGVDQPNSPQIIQATAPENSSVLFNAAVQNQRAALALSQGVVYVAWASYGDSGSYNGWVVAYNSTTLAVAGIFNATPNGSQGGIWMAGAAPAFDTAGNAYFPTGNGTFDGTTDFGESLVKLSPGAINELDYFAPSDYATLNSQDLDFGSAGPTMLPGTSLIIQGGKEGKLYLLNTNSLGHEAAGDVQIPQVFQAVDTTIRPSATHHIHNASPAWIAPSGLNVYVWGENDFIHIYQLVPATQILDTTPLATGSILPPQGMPGGMMTISATGSQSGTGIVWATVPLNGDANQATVPGSLYAFNAENLNLLWSSTGPGDDLFNFSKGSAPIVANGKVYAGSLSRFVQVYGLKSDGQDSQDLALNQAATGSTPCTSSEGPGQAFNGSVSGGLGDKWCSTVANPWLQVDLGSPRNISRFVLEHAGAGGENPSLNTAAFNIQISSDGVNFTTVVNVTGNQDSITTSDITPTTARYVLLNIVTPTQSGGPPASIYEFEIFGPQGNPAAGFTLSASPASATVTAGGTASYTATVTALYGFTGAVTMSASGLPTGATAVFSPATVSGAGTSAVSLLTTASTPAGTYTVTLTGTSGALQQTSTVTLVVNAAQVGIPAAIASSAGTPQSATVGTTFATALQATVTNASNNPVSGAAVTFAAPASGAGASFGGSAAGSATATVMTNTNGVATAPTLTANGTAGSYAVTASVSGVAAVASFSLTNNPVSANGYSYSRTITIASTQVPNTDQTNFPVLFSSTDSRLMSVANGGHVANANGYDIIFTADAAGTQKLNHEIESYNGTSGQFIAWV
ncbi:MAG: discoidin domain-containing protein, partial [Bryobacteraceae bacterium]